MLEKGLAGAVARDDAGALLPAMLQREQAVIGQHRRIWMTEYAEKPALVLREARRDRTILGDREFQGAWQKNIVDFVIRFNVVSFVIRAKPRDPARSYL